MRWSGKCLVSQHIRKTPTATLIARITIFNVSLSGFPNSRTLGLESGNGAGAGDIHDDEYDTTDVPRDQRQRANSVASSASVNSSPMVIDEESRIHHALKTENVAQIEGKFLSFIDMRSKHLTSEGSRISSGRASSSSLGE